RVKLPQTKTYFLNHILTTSLDPVPCLTASCLPNGNDANDLALHFNPRFHDNTAGCCGEVRRETPNPLHRGKEAKVREIYVFEVEIPDDHEFKFPNQESVDVISYIRIGGDFKLTSLKIC
uniref:Galectin domain-containing protein n=1 Tax=Takifugu rubripes TaxID=31033 RepID=A0A674MPE1_TAKRU